MIIYAIGDIHGMSNQLKKMLDEIYKREPGIILTIGDYIDRGPDSKGVLDILIEGPQKEGFSFIHLMGNHEDMCIHAHLTKRIENWNHWLMNGGDYTQKSFGNSIEESIPEKYLSWMNKLWIQYETDEYYFVHAGVQPGIDLDKQLRQDKLWIRHPFLSSKYDWGKRIIHGHTPNDQIVIRPNRICLDSAAFHSGILSCGIFDGTKEPEYIQIKGRPAPQFVLELPV